MDVHKYPYVEPPGTDKLHNAYLDWQQTYMDFDRSIAGHTLNKFKSIRNLLRGELIFAAENCIMESAFLG